jgi:aldehyde dehydrogenase (NAD+)
LLQKSCLEQICKRRQTCVAPDYLLVHADIKEVFIKKLKNVITAMYGADPKQSPDYARMVSDKRFEW